MSTPSSRPNAYVGIKQTRPPQQYTYNFDPTPSDYNNFDVGDEWLNRTTYVWWKLCLKIAGSSLWEKMAGPGVDVETITTPDSVVVVPDSNNNMNFLASGISITGSGSNVTFSVSAISSWVVVNTTSRQMANYTGYIANHPSLQVALSLPVTASVGSMVRIVGQGPAGWTVVQASGQTIYFGNKTSTTGLAGGLTSTNSKDCITLLCVIQDIGWQVIDSIGNITVI